MKKIILTLSTMVLTLNLSACNSGGSTTDSLSNTTSQATNSLPIIAGKNNQQLFTLGANTQEIQLNSSPLTNNRVISLKPLTQDQANKAQELGQQQANLLATTRELNGAFSSTYSAASSIKDTNSFFDSTQEVLDQGAFGSCVSFATDTALGYLSLGNTNAISPLDTLFQGYLDYPHDMTLTGWDGLDNSGQVLTRVIDAREGYYHSYTQTKQLYKSLSDNYAALHLTSDLTFANLNAVTGFNNALQSYSNLTLQQKAKQISNITYNDLHVSQGSANNARKIKQALDNGHKVVLGFTIYDYTQKPGCSNGEVQGDSYYSYSNGNLTMKENSKQTDAWTKAYGCVLGGHEVFVTSYFQNSAGQLIFLIRNSWSDSVGNQGNFYMTADYLNQAGTDGFEVYTQA